MGLTMTTDKQEAAILETARERYADKLQADAYKAMASMNDVYDWYCREYNIAEDEEEDAYQQFVVEFTCGQADTSGKLHKIISDLCWKKSQTETDTEWLKNEFYYSYKYSP
jgi:hypothetical protein